MSEKIRVTNDSFACIVSSGSSKVVFGSDYSECVNCFWQSKQCMNP